MYVCVYVCIYDYICILISMSSEMSKHVVQYLITERKARFAYCKVDQDSSRLFSAGPYDGFKQRESEMLHGAHGAALGASLIVAIMVQRALPPKLSLQLRPKSKQTPSLR